MVSKIGNVDTNVISVDGGWVETTNAKRTKFYIFAIINTSIEYIYMCTHTHTDKLLKNESSRVSRVASIPKKLYMLNLFWVLHCTLLFQMV